MEVQKDFKELLELFNAHNVEYIIVGGYALAFHGAPRFTGDIDLLVKADVKNAERILSALKDFGFEFSELSVQDFQSSDKVIQLGVPPVRVDLLTSLTAVSWRDAESSKIEGKYGDIPVYFIGKQQFILNKKALGRKKDLADLEALGED